MKELIQQPIVDIYPSKAQFKPEDDVSICVELDMNVEFLEVVVTHFERTVFSKTMESFTGDLRSIKLNISKFPIGGYGVSVKYQEQVLTTAFDVARSHIHVPRYGFLSDFGIEDEADYEDIKSMLKLHINLVQFYDWMYRHESLVSEEPIYKDLMGKEMSLKAIKQKIEGCHQQGMKTMAYGAIYAASKAFYEMHKSWGMYNSAQKPITFIDIFYIMDIRKKSPWHHHIISEYKKAVDILDFDGIHMDTYGFPKTGFDIHGKYIQMDQEFPTLINNTKAELNNWGQSPIVESRNACIEDEKTVIFNNVGNWPVYSTASANQDILYVEVWEPYVTYEHIQRIIREARQYSQKTLIISAYLKPYMTSNQDAAGYALKLMTACVVSNGSTHLIMGENKKVLTQGYYVDNYPIDDEHYDEIRRYYDFIVRYEEFFFDKSLVDVSMTHAFGDNLEYRFSGAAVSPYAEGNKVWTVIRENRSMSLISLINLQGNNNKWNEEKSKPESVKDFVIEIQVGEPLEGMYIMSPEDATMRPLDCEMREEIRGKVATINIEELNLWTVIVVKKES